MNCDVSRASAPSAGSTTSWPCAAIRRKAQEAFQPVAGGFRYACEMVALDPRRVSAFGIAVAGYPETHREAASPEADLENLRRKVDSGADIVITQLFYRQRRFLSLSRALPAGRHSRADRAGHLAGHESGADPAHRVAVRRPGCRRPFRRPLAAQGDDAEGAIRGRRRLRHPPGAGLDRRRHAGHALLCAQQVAGHGRPCCERSRCPPE